jgi:2-isopropylmalate synthase
VESAKQRLGGKIGIHTHNDIGLGVANALAAIEVGSMHVQGTINGYGERTGNCNLTSVIPVLVLKMKKRCLSANSLAKLKELSQFVDEIANIRHDPRQPWVGAAAFAHKGGTHVNAVQKVIHSYEHINPELVGNTRRVLISDLAGRSNIIMKAQELGFKIAAETPELRRILTRVKELEHAGYEFEAAEASLALLIRKTPQQEESPFKVDA